MTLDELIRAVRHAEIAYDGRAVQAFVAARRGEAVDGRAITADLDAARRLRAALAALRGLPNPRGT